MSWSSWPSTAAIAKQLLAEAEGDCKRLGHQMVGWIPVGQEYRSRCHQCLEPGVVRPRSQADARMGGPALNLRCGGKRK